MKVHEILKEAGLPDGTLKQYSDYEQSPDSPENLDYAVSDIATQEIVKIQQDPMEYYRSHGEDAGQYAERLAQVLSRVNDKTLNLIGNSPSVQRTIEDNYDPESDSSYIPLEDMLQVMGKLEKMAPDSRREESY